MNDDLRYQVTEIRDEIPIGNCWVEAQRIGQVLSDRGIEFTIMCGGIAAQLEGVESSAADCRAIGNNHYWVETDNGVVEAHSLSEADYDSVQVYNERPDNYVVFDDSPQ